MKTPLPIRQTIDAKGGTVLHTSVDIRWLLETRTSRQLADAVTVNGKRVDDGEIVRNALLNQLAEGHALLPIGDPCEGWDPKTGCPGHRIEAIGGPIIPDNGRENADERAEAEAHHHERAHGARDP
jgi:hypothetical protein